MGRSSRVGLISIAAAALVSSAGALAFADQSAKPTRATHLGVDRAEPSARFQNVVFGFSDSAGIIDQPYLSDIPDVFGILPPPQPYPAPLPPTPAFNAPAMQNRFAHPALPRCPLIIRVGKGLQHPAHTKVIYGRQSCI